VTTEASQALPAMNLTGPESPFDKTWRRRANRPLLAKREISEAIDYLGPLPKHATRTKNWDTAIAAAWAITLSKDAAIVDAGVGLGSSFLLVMQELGYRDLIGIGQERHGPMYLYGDITAMPFADGSKDFILCQSVIEHGVDTAKFVAEAARVLKPGGYLFISTDYWHEPIDTGDRVAFGQPVKIMSPGDVCRIACEAAEVRLYPVQPILHGCEDRCCQWMGLDFTFITLMFRKGELSLDER
jgi:SAM-dependent methyltransferase